MIKIGLTGRRPNVFMKPFKFLLISLLDPPSMANGATRSPNHFRISLSQFLTKLLGHTTITFSAKGLH